jgi:DNA-directed RNA polymerase sigma subunit (sigma70/sigma32)
MFTMEDAQSVPILCKLTKKEENYLLERIKNIDKGSLSRNELEAATVSKKLLLRKLEPAVALVVGKYIESKLSAEELVILAKKGLKKALTLWDSGSRSKKKFRFSIYASWFMRAAIHEKLGYTNDPEDIQKRK